MLSAPLSPESRSLSEVLIS